MTSYNKNATTMRIEVFCFNYPSANQIELNAFNLHWKQYDVTHLDNCNLTPYNRIINSTITFLNNNTS